MSYRLVRSAQGALVCATAAAPIADPAIPDLARPDAAPERPPAPPVPPPGEGVAACADRLLAEVHASLQDGAPLFAGDRDDGSSDDSGEEEEEDDDNNNNAAEKDAECDGGPPGPEAFLRHLSERMAGAAVLLGEEGAQERAQEAGELAARCRAMAEGGRAADCAGVQALRGDVGRLLRRVRPVDLDLLLQLLRAGQDAGDTMQDKDVLLFIGQSGSGKTSLVHYLAGSTFEEVIVDGSYHLKVVNVPHPGLEDAATSSSTRSVTRSVKAVDITTASGDALAICDSPGFDDTDGIEVDVANGFGLVAAIRRAKRVKPVLVLSEKGVGDRFGAVSQVLRTLSRLVGTGDTVPDPAPFAYAFTKYEPKYAPLLHQQFKKKSKELTPAEREDASFKAFVRDIQKKTKPRANIVSPLDPDGRAPLLSSLVQGGWYEDPAASFSVFVSETSLDKLSLQLRLTETSIRKALARGDASLVMVKLSLLVELGHRLPAVAAVAKQCTDGVADFLEDLAESLSCCIGKCTNLRDHADAFQQELRSAKDIMEVLVAFAPVAEKWTSLGSDFCARSMTALTDCFEERVFSLRGNCEDFISALRQHQQVAVTDLCRLKDIHDTFESLSHAVPRTTMVYPECSQAMVKGITMVVENLHQNVTTTELPCTNPDASQFMPNSFLLSAEADFQLVAVYDTLKDQSILPGNDHGHLITILNKAVAAVTSNLQNKFDEVIQNLTLSGGDLKVMVDMDQKAIADVKRVLDFLVGHSALTSCLRQITNIVVPKLQELGSCINTFVQQLVDSIEAEISIAVEEGDHSKLRDTAHCVTKADKLCIFCRDTFHETSAECDKQGKRLAVLGKFIDDHLEKLTAKQQSMLEQAKHYLHVVKTQDPTAVLADIATAWEQWEVFLAQAPKKEKPGMMKRFFSAGLSAIGLASNESSKESDFDRQLNTIKIKIGQGLRHRLERACRDIKSAPSVLFFVVICSMQSRSIITWIFNPPNGDSCDQLYVNAQRQLVQYLESFSVESLTKAHDYVAIRNTLDDLRENAHTWKKIKEIVQSMDPKNEFQPKFCSSLLAVKDYEFQRQCLISYVLSIQSSIASMSFLDETRARSINECDRNELYREIAGSFSVFKDVRTLQCHLSSEVDISSLLKESLEHAEKQTQTIHKYLTQLMASFPNFEADFQRLYIWRSNFHSIEKCFGPIEPKIAGIACRSRESIDREMQLTLKKIKPPRDIPNTVPLLLLLKKASNGILCWRHDINQIIDELLLSMSNMAQNSGRFILGVDLELKNVDGIDKAVALQILSEHNCFDGATNAVFNSATARQGIDYVVDSIDVSLDAKDILQAMYRDFQQKYKSLVEEGLLASNNDTMTSFFCNLVEEAGLIAADYSADYRFQLVHITAHVFTYWSLKSMNSFVTGAISDENTKHAATEYLMKPHAAQIVSIWCLLNFEHKEFQNLKDQNHLVEILTGEGKSIALGVTAIILAMLNCDVVCVCYSAYLSSRDYDAFKLMFSDFGVLSSIKYSTLRDACEELYNSGGDTRSLAEDIAWGNTKMPDNSENRHERVKVLLIDEVDVFFKPDFYGETFRAVHSLRHHFIEELLADVWKNRNSTDVSSLAASPMAQDCLKLFPKDIRPIISKHVNMMLNDAQSVESHDYIVCDGKICYKEFDGVTSRWLYDYLTTFAGMKEQQNGRVTNEAMKLNLCIWLKCGQSSYAEIPNMFDVILGVSGTLKSLSQHEKDILRHQYNINKMTYVPSVYGKNKLLFAGDNPKDVIMADDDANFHLELRSEINTRRKPDKDGAPLRAVMVFFESRDELEAFYESEQMRDIKSVTRVLTEELAIQDKEGAFLQATRSGAITLLIREFGRGTDFKCYDAQMLDGGGVHVIQAFFSTENSEEIQIKGRAARQGSRGSYSMVLHVNALIKNMGLTKSEIQSKRRQSKFYTYLDSTRSTIHANMCSGHTKTVKEAETWHYETIDFKQCALHNKRKDAIEYLKKWNGIAFVMPCSVATKASFIDQKRKRIEKHQQIEQKKRSDARSKKTTANFSGGVPEASEEELFGDTPIPMMIEDKTHYEVLGVSQKADIGEIESAFRRASLLYHPDRNYSSNARDSFNRLTEAKEVLCCPAKRRAYDEGLL